MDPGCGELQEEVVSAREVFPNVRRSRSDKCLGNFQEASEDSEDWKVWESGKCREVTREIIAR